MKGTVIRRGTSWSFVAEVGRDANGKRIRKWSSGHPTKKVAETELRAYLHRVESGGDPFPTETTLSAYLDKWLGHQANRIRPTTLARYRTLLERDVIPAIGSMRLDKIRPGHVQDVLDRMGQRGLAPRTIVQGRAALSSALRQAVAWGLIAVNPVAAVKPPKPERPKLVTPTPAQLAQLLSASKGSTWEIPIVLACSTGARRSEVLALRWQDVDLSAGRIRITQTLQKVPSDGHSTAFMDPKTQRARREIALMPPTIARLKTHRHEQTQRRLALGPEWHDYDLVCERGDGHPLYPDSFTKTFKKIAADVGLPGVRLHDVRHGVATALLSEGVHPAITSAVLGHSSAAFTMDVYSHVTDGMTGAAADALGRALGESQ